MAGQAGIAGGRMAGWRAPGRDAAEGGGSRARESASAHRLDANPGVEDSTGTAQELEPKESLRADCARCKALCCVALSFRASTEFAADKPPGVACPHLDGGHACGIHGHLRAAGYRGCASFDCFGAGQHVSAHTCAEVHWEDGGEGTARMFAVFDVVRRLKQLLWHLADASVAAGATPLRAEVDEMRCVVQTLVWEDAATLDGFDVFEIQSRVLLLLAEVSSAQRGMLEDCSGLLVATADLQHADFTRANLRGADLRYAQLASATLAEADLTGADLLGADLRGADVRGAQLADSLYLTQMQVEPADGDEATTLPGAIQRPARWVVTSPPRR